MLQYAITPTVMAWFITILKDMFFPQIVSPLMDIQSFIVAYNTQDSEGCF